MLGEVCFLEVERREVQIWDTNFGNSFFRGVIIYELIVIVILLVILQKKIKMHGTCIKINW